MLGVFYKLLQKHVHKSTQKHAVHIFIPKDLEASVSTFYILSRQGELIASLTSGIQTSTTHPRRNPCFVRRYFGLVSFRSTVLSGRV